MLLLRVKEDREVVGYCRTKTGNERIEGAAWKVKNKSSVSSPESHVIGRWDWCRSQRAAIRPTRRLVPLDTWRTCSSRRQTETPSSCLISSKIFNFPQPHCPYYYFHVSYPGLSFKNYSLIILNEKLFLNNYTK